MKITLTIILLGLIVTLNAQSYIRVSNNPGAVADYTNLQTAINSASVGTTIFVEPSTTSYGAITINKRLTLLGGGYDATKHNNKKSEISSVTLSKQTNNPNRTIISGFLISSDFGIGTSTYLGIDSITIMRCQINSYLYIQGASAADSSIGWKIVNNKINYLSASLAKNLIISNNVIYVQIVGLNQYSVFFTNNALINNPSYPISFVSFSNNIFYNGISSNWSNCTFSNNINKQGCSSLCYGDNVCSNNIEGVAANLIFVNYNTGDYHLVTSPTLSPGKLAGSDGTDIGIYGGLYPWPSTDYGITGYPEVMSLNITNPVIETNGTLKVNVKSRIIH